MRNVLRDNCQSDPVSAYDIYIGGKKEENVKKRQRANVPESNLMVSGRPWTRFLWCSEFAERQG